jgi:hypothetical protein
MRGKQGIHNEAPLALKLHSATAYLETLLELYQRRETPMKLAEQLQGVIGMIRGIRREVLTRELTAVLHNEDLPEAGRIEKVGKIFQLLAKDTSL